MAELAFVKEGIEPSILPQGNGGARMTRWVVLSGMLTLVACDPDCVSKLEVVVTDETGERVPDATCRIDNSCCNSMSPAVCVRSTDSAGRAVFPFGSEQCTVEVNKPGFATATETHRFAGCDGVAKVSPVLRPTAGE